MTEVDVLSNPQSPSKKRPLEDEAAPSTPKKCGDGSPISSTLSTPLSLPNPHVLIQPRSSAQSPQKASPALSANSSVSGEPRPSAETRLLSTTQPPAKRRKLTPQEKLLKEAEAQQKAEERRRKAEEREEKKRAKAIETQHKAQEREKKKSEKEEAAREKEKAARKKERSQMRLNSFFDGVKTTPAPLNPAKTLNAPETPNASTDNVVERGEQETAPIELFTNKLDLRLGIRSQEHEFAEYRKTFLPFALPKHTTISSNLYMSEVELDHAQDRLDSILKDGSREDITILELSAAYRRPRGCLYMAVKDLLEEIEGRQVNTVDLTSESDGHQNVCMRLLKETPIKYLYFSEDVRPPYCGTWTKPLSPQQWRTLSTNPCKRVIEALNYDYDSEAEWEEPEEGEELDSDGEEDLDEEDEDDDMEGFVDDEHDSGLARRLNMTELQVQCTGVCWQHLSGLSKRNDGSEAVDLAPYQLETLLDPSITSIDPFSATYWQKSPRKTVPALLSGQTRLPLGNNANGVNRQIVPSYTASALAAGTASEKKSAAPKAPKRFIRDADMDAFKQAVKGRTETKQQLVPILQSLFQKKYPKDIIAATLSHVASRNTMHKQWFLLEMPSAPENASEATISAKAAGPID